MACRCLHTPAGKTPPAGQRCNGWDTRHSRVPLLILPPTHFLYWSLVPSCTMYILLLIITIFFFFPHPAVIIDSSIPQSGFKWAGPRLQGFLRLYFQPHTTSHIVFIASIVEGFLALRHMSYFELAFMFYMLYS